MEDALDRVMEFAGRVTTLEGVTQLRLLRTIAIILILGLLRAVVLRVVQQQTDDARIRYQARKIVTYTAAFVGLFLIGREWFHGLGDLATFLGLLSAGLALALRDPVVNLAGWAFILWRHPFRVGHRIQIGEHRGDVIDLRIFQFSLLEIGRWVDAEQSTGRIIHVPNGKVFNEALANYSQGFQYIWNEIPVSITFDSDWEKAKGILLGVAERHAEHLSQEAERRVLEASRNFMIVYSTLTPTVYTSVRENGVLLTIRYLCAPRARRGTEQAIWEDVLRAFAAEPDINFAYPTRRLLHNVLEATGDGRPGVPAAPAAGPRTEAASNQVKE